MPTRPRCPSAIVAAAQATGIGLTLLPVLYGAGGFGGRRPSEGQRRFLNDPDAFLRLIETLRSAMAAIRRSASASRRIRCAR